MEQKKNDNKDSILLYIIIVLVIVASIAIYNIVIKNWDFFEIKFKDIIQMGIDIFIGYGVYRLIKKDNKRDKINEKAREILEKIIFIVDNKLTPLEKCITIENLKINIKDLSNNIMILSKILSVNKEYEADVKYIEDNYKGFEAYISEHTDMTIEELLSDQTRKDKLTNYIVSIKNRALDTECNILIN